MRYIDKFSINEKYNLYSKKTGIDNIVIYIGPPSDQHWHRVKVSNIANSFSSSDNFVISIPEYKIVEGTPDKWVNKKFEEIIDFLKLNETLIISFSEGEIFLDEFIKNIKKINQQ